MVGAKVRRLGVLVACFGTGCASYPRVEEQRPPTTPSPTTVAEEIQDARYFLALPHDEPGSAVETGMRPQYDNRGIVP